MLGKMFSMRYLPSLYKEGQMPSEKSLEQAVRRAEGWCEVAACLKFSEELVYE
jgi:hypothetical protein